MGDPRLAAALGGVADLKPLPDFRQQIRRARTVGLVSMAVSGLLMGVLTPSAKGVLHIAHLGSAQIDRIHVDTAASADGVCAELEGIHGDSEALQQWLTSGRSEDGSIEVSSTAPQGAETYELSRLSVASVTQKPAPAGGRIDSIKVKCARIAKSR